MNTTTPFALKLAGIALLSLAVACDGADTDPMDTDDTTDTDDTDDITDTDGDDTDGDDTDAEPTQSIYEIATSNHDFSTLKAAIDYAELDGTLSASGTFTVFAPTNAAFDAALTDLGVTELTDLGTPQEVATILLYHVLGATVRAANVAAGPVATLSQNEWEAPMSFFIGTEGGVTINDANVTATDISATNGVIHVLDMVLMPPTLYEAAGFAGLTGLTGAIEAADATTSLRNVLNGEGPLTVFAPTNAAFTAVAAIVADLPGSTITTAVQTHVITGSYVTSGDLTNGDVTTASFVDVTIDADATPPTVSWDNTANIIGPDLHVSNGVVHMIDAVLLPDLD